MVSLLDQLVYSTRQRLNFDVVNMKTLAIASVKATESGKGEYQNRVVPILRGTRDDNHKPITLFPGAVPPKLPDEDYWREKNFNFINFLPAKPVQTHEVLPHLRLDQVLQFLMGDKMK